MLLCYKVWGGLPGPRGTPSSRSSLEESSPSTTRQAGQGAGRGRGRPPHQLCRRALVGKVSGIELKPAPRVSSTVVLRRRKRRLFARARGTQIPSASSALSDLAFESLIYLKKLCVSASLR